MVRVRFAPSPTGGLHIGGVRTALYNYVFAKKMNGKMILRIEDTDQSRYVEGAEKYIKDALEWFGIETDEDPNKGGEFGPYTQSERKSMYKQYADQLINSDNAYYAFDTPDELVEMRERLKSARVTSPQYNSISRMQMKNSLTLPEDEVQKRIESGEKYVIRLKVPRKEEIRINDKVRGWVMVHSSAVDDKVLMKSDGMPTYHLANVVDDHLMKITHVIRGEEWLPSAPLHVLLYKYLGWEDSMPEFAHLPLLLKPDGNGKLSKRDADKNGFPIFPFNWRDLNSGEVSVGFKESGYLPDAMVNFLALLGWSPGNNDELFSMSDLIERFTLERIGKAGVKFDIEKAKWFNEFYLRSKSNTELSMYINEGLTAKKIVFDSDKLNDIAEQLKDRASFPDDLVRDAQIFFVRPQTFDEKVIRKKWKGNVPNILTQFANTLGNLEPFTNDVIKDSLHSIAENHDMGIGAIMQPLRVSLTGTASGSDLMSLISILGSKESSERIMLAIDKIASIQEV